jgi:hypothetical protein
MASEAGATEGVEALERDFLNRSVFTLEQQVAMLPH